MINKNTQIMIAATLLAIATIALCPATGAAQCATPGQAMTAYYPPASPCATGACAPAIVEAYRPAYRPLFAGSSQRSYQRLMRRWNRWWSRNEPVAVNPPVMVTAAYGAASGNLMNSCTTCNMPVTCYKPQQCCRYVPQTCYRTEVCNIPVTTYRPVSSCDPCTGCVTTCMKPCTTYQQQARRVPYTTYRMVCETRYTPVTSCAPACLPAACGTGNCAVGNCATGNCATGNCATGNCAMGGSQPMVGQATAQPTLSPAEVQSNKPAADTDVEIDINPDVEIQPMRDLDDRHRPSLESESYRDDKMAALNIAAPPIHRVSMVEPATQVANDGGWRASNR